MDSVLFYDNRGIDDRIALAAGSIAGGAFKQQWSIETNINDFGSYNRVVGSLDRMLFYNPFSGEAPIFALSISGFTTLAKYPADGLSKFWTHVVEAGGFLFFYNAGSGSAAVSVLDERGVTTINSYAPHTFSSGWTHVAAMGRMLIFYNFVRGAGALGEIDNGAFRMLRTYEDASFSSGWTHLICNGDRFLFYNIMDGSGAVAAVQGNELITVDNLEAGQFTTGWTHLAGNNDGVIFYNTKDGSAVVGQIVSGGFATITPYAAGEFSAGWTHVISLSCSRLRARWDALQGFAWPPSVRPGEEVAFSVSAGTSTYSSTCVQFKNAAGPLSADQIDNNEDLIEIPVGEATQHEGKYQFTDFSPAEGCEQWEESFRFPVPGNWNSGIFAMKCQTLAGDQHSIPFVVNPPDGKSGDLCLVVNTNTWAAYNDWGGYDRYYLDGFGPTEFSIKRPNFWLFETNTVKYPYYCRHLLRSELWVFNWLREHGYKVDLWTDLDFHAGIDRLNEYAAIVVTTHPEYWSVQMMNYLKSYLEAGGCFINLGGNELYDAVEVADDFGRITVYGHQGTGRTNLFRQFGQPESSVLGVAFPWSPAAGDDGNCRDIRVPYRAKDVDHPFMQGIASGDLIGTEGWGYDPLSRAGPGAAGWEVDIVDENSPKLFPAGPLRLLALGTNTENGGKYDACMVTTYNNRPGEGWVFSVGSMNFAGSVPIDAKVQQILHNVLNTCLGP
jgi:hypothetical protein